MESVAQKNIYCLSQPLSNFKYSNKPVHQILNYKNNDYNTALIDKNHNQTFIRKNLSQNKNLSFESDFGWKYMQHDYSLLSSQLFRRDYKYGCHCPDYQDVIDSLDEILNEKQPIKMLVAGVAEGEEPISLLAVISELTGHKPIEETVDLNLTDFNPKPKLKTEFWKPDFATSSFEKNPKNDSCKLNEYILKPSIMNYLQEVYKDCDNKDPNARSKWNINIQDYSKEAPSEEYDVISYNNVACYINKDQDKIDVLKNFVRMLNVGGLLITDPYETDVLSAKIGEDKYMPVPDAENMRKIKPGIWKKID